MKSLYKEDKRYNGSLSNPTTKKKARNPNAKQINPREGEIPRGAEIPFLRQRMMSE